MSKLHICKCSALLLSAFKTLSRVCATDFPVQFISTLFIYYTYVIYWRSIHGMKCLLTHGELGKAFEMLTVNV